ncbi:MAG: hypothetical protein RSC01_02480 [Oscillospiraceae bacterium]
MKCDTILKSKSITTTGGNNNIVFGNTECTLVNGSVLKVIICQAIPMTTPLGTVSFTVNGVTFPVVTKYANSLRNDQIQTRRVYTVALGAEKPTLNMLTCIPKSGYVFPTYPPKI